MNDISNPVYSKNINSWGILFKYSNYFINYQSILELIGQAYELNSDNYSIPIKANLVSKNYNITVNIWIDKKSIRLAEKIIRNKLELVKNLENSVSIFINYPYNLPYDILFLIKSYTIFAIKETNALD